MPGRFGQAIMAAAVAAVVTASGSARADYVPPFKGNDTGGIIAYPLAPLMPQARAIAAAHCAGYGKAARITGVQRQYGGYVSFACLWVRPRVLVVVRRAKRLRGPVIRALAQAPYATDIIARADR